MEKNNQLLFGRKPILEALEDQTTMDRVFVRKGLKDDGIFQITNLCRAQNVPVLYVPQEKLNRLTRKNHQGVVAYSSPVPFYEVNDILSQVYDDGEIPLVVILDGVTDVHNFGAIARTAYCAGAHCILTGSTGSAALNGSSIKASAGALLKLPICRVPNIVKGIKDLKAAGVSIITTEAAAEKEVQQLDLKIPLAFVMGAEGAGVSNEVLRLADSSVRIPMQRKFDSYNVSVAAAMLLYECMRQKSGTEI